MTNNLIIRQLELGQLANYVYIVGDPDSLDAIIIDPCDEVPAIQKAISKDSLSIKAILLTHGHYDHVLGAEALSKKFNAPVYLSAHEASLYDPRCSNMLKTNHEETLAIGSLKIRCIHTPGHTPGCQCFLINGNLFTGDTLFIDAIGRTDFPGGSSSTLFESLKRIKSLDNKTMIWPGHNYGAVSHQTLGVLRNENPFLACATVEDFLDLTG